MREAAHRPLAPARRKAEAAALRPPRRAAPVGADRSVAGRRELSGAAAGLGLLGLDQLAGSRASGCRARHSRAPNSRRRNRSCRGWRRPPSSSRTIGSLALLDRDDQRRFAHAVGGVDLGAGVEQPLDGVRDSRPAPRRSAACRRPCRGRLGSAPLLSRKPAHSSSRRAMAMISGGVAVVVAGIDEPGGLLVAAAPSPCRRRASRTASTNSYRRQLTICAAPARPPAPPASAPQSQTSAVFIDLSPMTRA